MERDKQATKLSPSEAKRKITLILKEGRFEVSKHCRRESMPKRNVYDPDILNVLKTGEIIRDPEWSEDYGEWKYTVEGIDTEDDELSAVVVFIDVNFSLLVITVF